jgi:Flp pilus assembly protein TadG
MMSILSTASLFRCALNRIKDRGLNDQRGSASVEFSLLAVPLFIPLFIFISHFSHSTDAQDSLRTLARETVRAFVTSRDDETAFYVAHQVLTQGAQLLGYEPDSLETVIDMKIVCRDRPCISPDNRILIELTMKAVNGTEIEVAAIEYVSPWI